MANYTDQMFLAEPLVLLSFALGRFKLDEVAIRMDVEIAVDFCKHAGNRVRLDRLSLLGQPVLTVMLIWVDPSLCYVTIQAHIVVRPE
jgi:hypothetical protein